MSNQAALTDPAPRTTHTYDELRRIALRIGNFHPDSSLGLEEAVMAMKPEYLMSRTLALLLAQHVEEIRQGWKRADARGNKPVKGKAQ